MNRRGHTLIELSVSLAMMGVLLAAMGGAVALASRAMPSGTTADGASLDAAEALESLSGELRYAVHFTERGARSVGLTVADRDGDGDAEHIRYAWSGVAGQPLTRSYNGGAPIAVSGPLAALAFNYVAATPVVERYDGPIIESEERVIAAYTSAQQLRDEAIESGRPMGQWLVPQNVPSNALTWKPTRVSLWAGAHSFPFENSVVRLQAAAADRAPTGSVLAQHVVGESGLGVETRWHRLTLSPQPQLSPTAAYCLTVAHQGSGLTPSMQLGYENRQTATSSGLLRSNDAGSSWNFDNRRSLMYELHGTYMLQMPEQTVTRRHLAAVDVELRPSVDGVVPARSTVRLLNMPENLAAYWHADFTGDPTKLDANDDGQRDWGTRSGAVIVASNLADGQLRWSGDLDTSPKSNFTSITLVEARMRSASGDTTLWINADWSAGVAAPIFARLRKNVGPTQTLELLGKSSNSTNVSLATVANLPDDFVRVRLLIDPAKDSVNLAVDGRYVGTYRYTRFPVGHDDRFVTLSSGSGSRWDWATVRVLEDTP